jgi:hypothetical protein
LPRLQARLALAVITPFTPVFSTVAHGNIAIIDSTVETVPASNAHATNARKCVGSLLEASDFNPMAYEDVV